MKPLFAVPAWLAGPIQAPPDFGLSAAFLITWLRPDTFGPLTVKHLDLVMLLEFIVIHSAGFTGAATLSAAFGFFYFLVLGLGEMLLVRKLAPPRKNGGNNVHATRASFVSCTRGKLEERGVEAGAGSPLLC